MGPPVAERGVSRHTGVGSVAIIAGPETGIHPPPDPFEQILHKAEEDLQTIFSQEKPFVLYFYELLFTAIPRRDLLKTALVSVIDEWGTQDKKRVADTYILFRNGREEDLIARANIDEARVAIPLSGGKLDAVEKAKTILGPLKADYVRMQIEEEVAILLGPETLRQARRRDHQRAINLGQTPHHPHPVRILSLQP